MLAAEGHGTEVVCLDAPDAPYLDDHPFPVHALGPGKGRYAYSRRLVPWLRTHAPEYDHVVVHGIWQFSSYGTWLALRPAGRPYLLYPHGMLDPWFKRAYPLKHLKKCLYWPWAERRVLRDARAVCFTCEEERVQGRRSFHPYRCREVVVNYGTAGPRESDGESQVAAFFTAYPHLNGKRFLLYLARIHPKKGCDLLIDAFAAAAASAPDMHLVMAGPDQTGWQVQLTRRAERLRMADRITWTGMLTGDVKWGAFRAAEAFVLPSHQENFGIAVAEALACGTPVLISNKVNIWREVQADGAGLAAGDTAAGTARLLSGWLALSPEARAAMRARARACFLNRFEIGQAARSLLATLAGDSDTRGRGT